MLTSINPRRHTHIDLSFVNVSTAVPEICLQLVSGNKLNGYEEEKWKHSDSNQQCSLEWVTQLVGSGAGSQE